MRNLSALETFECINRLVDYLQGKIKYLKRGKSKKYSGYQEKIIVYYFGETSVYALAAKFFWHNLEIRFCETFLNVDWYVQRLGLIIYNQTFHQVRGGHTKKVASVEIPCKLNEGL